MKAQLTALASSVRGKVAGTTFRNVGGSTILTTTSASLPGRIPKYIVNETFYQNTYNPSYRNALSYYSALWGHLSELQRKKWKFYSINGKTGYAAFLSANMTRSLINIRLNPLYEPVKITPIVLQNVRMGLLSASRPTLFFDAIPTPPLYSVGIYLTPPVPHSHTSARKRFKLIFSAGAQLGYSPFDKQMESIYGTIIPNARYFIRAVVAEAASGWRSLQFNSSFVRSDL